MAKVIAALAFGLMLVSGCALLSGEQTARERLAVQYATLKVIDGDPARAARVQALVAEARQYLTGGAEVTIARLDAEARARIDWQRLEAADRLLLEAVLLEARQQLTERLGAGVLDEGQRVALDAVLGWIEGAAYGYNTP